MRSKPTQPFRIVTFNTGLAVGLLPHVTERVPHVIEAIATLEAELVFVQEVWLDTHWDELLHAAGGRFPHAHRPPPTHPARPGACTTAEVEPLVECARKHCAGLESEDLARCVVRTCVGAAVAMSPPCLNCVASHPVGTLDEIVARCIGEDPPAEDARSTTPPLGGGHGPPGLVAYGGSFGLGLLSRLPLHDCELLSFEATTNARGAVYARIDEPTLGRLHVFGTHLSPGIHDEQSAQLDRLLPFIDERAGKEPAVLLGDLNLTPSSSLYARIVRAGFRNPYAERDRPAGTFTWHSLERGAHAQGEWMLDHILLRGLDVEATADRILDAPLVVRARDKTLRTTLSDHCGVRLTLRSAGGQ
jgi:endonuclease/exonuclease/phosphatase family metal-dependent hydrolase